MEVYLHLGLHKTGTTFLQSDVFPKIENISYYFKPNILTTSFLGEKVLISKEELSHNRVIGTKPEKLDYDFETAKKLSIIFKKSSVILGIRQTDSWVRSLYSRYVLAGFTGDFYKFSKQINQKYLKVNRYTDFLKTIFKRVFIYNFEDLKNNPIKIVDELCEFMGVTHKKIEINIYNVSLSSNQLKVLTFFNKCGIFKIPKFDVILNKYILKHYKPK